MPGRTSASSAAMRSAHGRVRYPSTGSPAPSATLSPSTAKRVHGCPASSAAASPVRRQSGAVASVIRSPTPEMIATCGYAGPVPGDPALERAWREATPPGTGPVRRPPGLTELPLSSPQDRWWCAISGDPGHPSFNLFQTHRLRGPLDGDALARALGAVVDRHESLRATFPVRDGRPVQVIAPPRGLFLERGDARDPATARELVAGWTAQRFDLATGPLIRAYLLRFAP